MSGALRKILESSAPLLWDASPLYSYSSTSMGVYVYRVGPVSRAGRHGWRMRLSSSLV